ncbi:MAG: hypothetical protein KC910_36950 [Candidatus Eremiobacteraeota bacterium]|nr:hypothetical protein [Candidatus Eremiobacteraeota bacterium]
MTNGNTATPIQEMASDWQQMMFDTWQVWTKAMVESEAFSTTSAAMLDWNLAAQKQMRELSGQYMEALEIPRRSDLARVSAQIMAVEQRLADNEDERDEMKDTLDDIKSLLKGLAAEVASLKKNQTTEKAATPAKPKASKKRSTK